MKKTYMKPLTEAREMETESILCGSFSDSLNTTTPIDDSNSILSKENNSDLWSMDDED